MKIFIILVSGKKKKNTIVSISISMFVSFFAQLNNYYVQRTIQQLVKLAPCTMKKKKKTRNDTDPILSPIHQPTRIYTYNLFWRG